MRQFVGVLLVAALAGPAAALDDGFSVEEVVPDLQVPVFFDFAPDGRIFYNEYETGRVRVVDAQMQLVPEPVAHFTDVEVFFERGFLGLELDPDFAENHYLYVYYSSLDGTHKLVRIQEQDNVAVDITVLRDDLPLMGAGNHNGGPIVFGPDKTLYLSVGEMATVENAQSFDTEAGKILRMNRDGTVPPDNPYGNLSIWAYGIRNTFGMTWDPLRGVFWGSENGPTVHDEINVLVEGGNYGWPLWTGETGLDEFEDPLITWTPNICPTGIAVYCGSNYPSEYLGDLFLGNCDGGRIRRLEASLYGDAILDEDPTWFQQEETWDYYGVLDVVNGPDGNLWFSTAFGIYRFVYDDAPAQPGTIDCDLFDGSFPGLAQDDDDVTDDDDGDDDSASVVYKDCVCDAAGAPALGTLAGLASLAALAFYRCRRRG